MPGRWLLEVNVPVGLIPALKSYGVQADTAAAQGWEQLINGRLLEAGSNSGFTTILTRDRRFGESAARSLKRFPSIAVVLITLRQAPAPEFLSAFDIAWLNSPMSPIAGSVVLWP